jgi:hypothetical protein
MHKLDTVWRRLISYQFLMAFSSVGMSEGELKREGIGQNI